MVISYDDFVDYGCPSCGCLSIVVRKPKGSYEYDTCRECSGVFTVILDNSDGILIGIKHISRMEHPRKGIKCHAYFSSSTSLEVRVLESPEELDAIKSLILNDIQSSKIRNGDDLKLILQKHLKTLDTEQEEWIKLY